MRIEYWYQARKFLRKMGFSKLKSKSFAWKTKHLAEDMAIFKNNKSFSMTTPTEMTEGSG